MLAKEISYKGKVLSLVKYASDRASSFRFFQNLPYGISDEEIAQQFEANFSEYAKKTTTKVKHVILSLNPLSTPYVTDEKLLRIVSQYARLRAPESIIVGYKHVDKRHTHLHLIISGNKLYQDKSIRLDKAEYISRMKQWEAFQMEHFPELNDSLVYQHQRDKKLELSPKQTHKKEVIELLEELANKASSIDEFFALVEKHPDLDLYSYRNKTNGVFYKGKKYRFKTHISSTQYSALEQLQRWNELSKEGERSNELTL